MIDRLIERIEGRGAPIVVGLDPAYAMIPADLRAECFETHGPGPGAVAAMFAAYNRRILDAVCDLVPVVKPQIAVYEQLGPDGLRAYIDTARYAAKKGLLVIGDVKRGDIASTAEAYAAHLAGVRIESREYEIWAEDAITLNPYMGGDSLAPFLRVCAARDKGVFILVKTSNPGGADIQDQVLAASGLTVCEHVADLVSSWGADLIGSRGYSKVGAVVGATFAARGAALRARMPRVFFLVPGYGAQGAAGKDLRGFFDKDGGGCIVNSSRGIMAAWQSDARFGAGNIGDAAREAVRVMRSDIEDALRGRAPS
ncbi:MAG: orotidine-5'-phosphate decarboxylase [Clostridiales Family XIII bacterium]|jgi:orotidine-5'-phosphate decarboxylase|nr:orotidine-5'-phosphate decarboxylase [Clostridiales Family XIII bacterium]